MRLINWMMQGLAVVLMAVVVGLAMLMVSMSSAQAREYKVQVEWNPVTLDVDGQPLYCQGSPSQPQPTTCAATYMVYKQINSDGWLDMLTPITATQFLDVGNHPVGTALSYRVIALHGGLASEPSESATVVIPPAPPAKTTIRPLTIIIPITIKGTAN